MTTKVEQELARLRAEVEGLRPKPVPPKPPAPTWTGALTVVTFARTYWATVDWADAVPDGDPRAAVLLGRGGLPTAVDKGHLAWLRWAGCEFEEVR